jgi:hypothetical protein
MARSTTLTAGVGAGLLLAAACGVFLWEPWHGPIILSLSSGHGIDAGDLVALPLLAIVVAISHAQVPAARAGVGWPAGRWIAPASALVLGALLLLAGVVHKAGGGPLVPAAGGTFDGATEPEHVNAPDAEPVGHWQHLALTYDGSTLRLYENGTRVSSRAMTGAIARTSDPLWIGGNHPYGEYFQGLIDEVRVYDRPLSPHRVQAEMSTPVRRDASAEAPGLVAAYGFGKGSGSVAQDASGHGNAGTLVGVKEVSSGRYGGALRFAGAGEEVRVPASPSLDLRRGMTLAAWIRPSEPQDGWRTILHRQTDVYFLMAGSDRDNSVGVLDDLRAALLVGAAVWFCVVLAGGGARWVRGHRRTWWPPVALFVAGSVIDAVLAPTGTLTGPFLVAAWYGLTASRRDEATLMFLIAAVLAGVTVASLAGHGGLELTRDDGGIARSAALGLILVAVGLLGVRHGDTAMPPAARAGGSPPATSG